MKRIDGPTPLVWDSLICGVFSILYFGKSQTQPKPYEYPFIALSGDLTFLHDFTKDTKDAKNCRFICAACRFPSFLQAGA